jgi:ADP-heptose:LPS heptosyltransferase
MTVNGELLQLDPNITSLNRRETFFSVWSWYPDIVARRDATTNVLRETFARLGLGGEPYEYRARVFLSAEERRIGWELLGRPSKPVLTFHTLSNEAVKNWPLERWLMVLDAFRDRFHLAHLGDGREPSIDGVQRFAGQLTLRESMSVLAHAAVHVGGDSFLMHAANGLDVPSVVVFGGSRTPGNLGYPQNANLYARMPCGPCWIHASTGERCAEGLACLNLIEPDQVVEAALRLAGTPCGR